jgi:hypothetical protein
MTTPVTTGAAACAEDAGEAEAAAAPLTATSALAAAAAAAAAVGADEPPELAVGRSHDVYAHERQ